MSEWLIGYLIGIPVSATLWFASIGLPNMRHEDNTDPPRVVVACTVVVGVVWPVILAAIVVCFVVGASNGIHNMTVRRPR